jgi:predicted NAD/FAD-dependent oxidoreductase
MRVGIIGAGVAGLCAAYNLKQNGHDVSLFDKSRGVGGRLSTRYAGAFEYDHGAQYFTVIDPQFASIVQDAVAQGAVARWSGRALYLKTGLLTTDTGAERWVGAPRMNSFAKFLASDLDVVLHCRVQSLKRENDGSWTLIFEDGENGPIQDRGGFEAIICTAPSEQAKLILPETFSGHAEINQTKMDACFALMIGLETPFDIGWDTLRVNNLPVSWLSVNSSKPKRGEAATLVVHASPEWSNQNVDTDRDTITNLMLDVTAALTRLDVSNASHISLHRWLYASVSKSPNKPCLVDTSQNLIAAGDWCLGGRVEGAALSGLAAAEAIDRL